ncbi:MAG TPA: hypothetical protein PLQ78_02030 [Flavipsychrobacter sp.]|nr:hypothetical protein [Flavipsychrobacter sp.]
MAAILNSPINVTCRLPMALHALGHRAVGKVLLFFMASAVSATC